MEQDKCFKCGSTENLLRFKVNVGYWKEYKSNRPDSTVKTVRYRTSGKTEFLWCCESCRMKYGRCS